MGALGDGDLQYSAVPTRASELEGFGAITKIRGARSGNYPYNGCLVLANGDVRCMGLNNACNVGTGSANPALIPTPTQITGISGISTVEDATPADYGTCLLLTDRTVRCWGRNVEGQVGVPFSATSVCTPQNPGLTNVVQLDMGHYTTCAVVDDGANTSDGLGTVRCWGQDTEGSLGDGLPLANSDTPVTVSGITAAKSVSVGQDHACAVIEGGAAGSAGDTVKCWGDDFYGALGDDADLTDSNVPVDVTGLTDVAEVVTGGYSTCARLTDGTVWCWGLGTNGQLGHNALTSSGVPVQAVGITTAVELVGNNRGFCARLSNGTVQCWGQGTYGATGTGVISANTDRTPQTVINLTNVTQLGNSGIGFIAVKSDGTVWSWGWKYHGYLGIKNAPATLSATAQIVTPNTVGSGDGFSCRIENDGSVKCWGKNTYGQLGNGTTTDSSTPVSVSGITNAESIAVGADHACVVLYDGGVRCWGRNSDGQLGNNSTSDSSTPVTVGLIGDTALQITAGRAHSCAFLEGTSFNVRCWGDNFYGQLGDGTNTDRLQPATTSVSGVGPVVLNGAWQKIFAGADHTCGIMKGGAIRCWGRNDYYQLGDGTTTNQNRAVFVLGTESMNNGFSGPLAQHSCGITSDGEGRMFCWGDNVSGQLGNGTTSASATAVQLMNGAAGYTEATWAGSGASHSCASFRDGTVRCWGNNGSGRLGDTTTNNATSPLAVSGLTTGSMIALGNDHSCASTISGGVKCWGENQYGQLGNGGTTDALSPTDVSL